MHGDRIRSEIENLSHRRMAGCIGKLILVVVICGLAVKWAAGQSRAMTLFTVSLVTGLLWGLATSVLTVRARRVLLNAFTAAGVCIFVFAFALRTVFGASRDLALLTAVSPLMLPLGYYIGSTRLFRR